MHHEKKRGERERGIAWRTTVSTRSEIRKERSMAVKEVEDEGVALTKNQQEIVQIEEQRENALEGVPVERSVRKRRKRGDCIAQTRRFDGHFGERSVAIENGLEATSEI